MRFLRKLLENKSCSLVKIIVLLSLGVLDVEVQDNMIDRMLNPVRQAGVNILECLLVVGPLAFTSPGSITLYRVHGGVISCELINKLGCSLRSNHSGMVSSWISGTLGFSPRKLSYLETLVDLVPTTTIDHLAIRIFGIIGLELLEKAA